MRVPLSLLLSFCDPGLPADEIAAVLALTGTEVERITTLGVQGTENFVVGQVTALEAHPDADRLRVCTVDVGDGQPRTIVCGAANVAVGQLVPVALPGAIVNGGLKIKKSKLRGVQSEGMICSADELDLATGSEGILVLDASDGPAGRPLADLFVLNEVVLELEITPNRPDCLGVWGVARELHAATGAPLSSPPWNEDHGSTGDLTGVTISVDPEVNCARFTARIYDGFGAQAHTPRAAQAHLHAAGMRSISPVVDVTNYVMLVTGEPMHAFDLDRVEGASLRVRAAGDGEEVATLDGQSRKLDSADVLIEDASGPTSIAGLMGGARSEVSPSTTRVLLEAAVWDGPRLNKTSAKLALRSEASTRFEKGLAAALPLRAQAFASVLLDEWCGVKPQPGTIDITSAQPEAVSLKLAVSEIEDLLGVDVSADEAAGILTALDCEVAVTDGELEVIAAEDRLDLERPVDLIEEIARIKGLDKISATLPPSDRGAAKLTPEQSLERRLSDALVGAGAFEIAGWSFASTELFDRLGLSESDPRRAAVELRNPMSASESVMRTTLLGSLLDALSQNASHGEADLKLFELGPVYLLGDDGAITEPRRAAVLMSGTTRPANWRDQEPPSVDVHSAVGVLGNVLDSLRIAWSVEPAIETEPFLFPGRSGTVIVGGEPCGWIGELHPDVAETYGLSTVAGFEFDLAALSKVRCEIPTFEAFSPHPAVSQDLAMIVDRSVASSEVVRIAQAAGGDELESVELFDVYESDEIGEGKVSLAIRLTFRASDRTLTEDEASTARAAILSQLENEIGATPRV